MSSIVIVTVSQSSGESPISAINVSSLNLSTIAAVCPSFKRTLSNSSICLLTLRSYVFSGLLYRKYAIKTL